MRLGSLMDGLAAARQVQADERPKLDFARAQRVWPLRTLIMVVVPEAMPADTGVVTTTGRLSWAPARIWLGLTTLGLMARSSGKRLPRPKVICASFQRESPRCTVTIFSAEIVAG